MNQLVEEYKFHRDQDPFYLEESVLNEEASGEDKDLRFDKKVDKILSELRDNDFGNEEARKKFIDLITTLHSSKDPRARKAFKRMGDLFTEIGDELIAYGQTEE